MPAISQTDSAFATSSMAIVSFFSISYHYPGPLVPYCMQDACGVKLGNKSPVALNLNNGKKLDITTTNTSSNFLWLPNKYYISQLT